MLVAELKRRRVFRALATYAVAAFAVLQIVEPILHGLHLPDATLTIAVVVLAAGFPVCALLAWAYDVSSSGIERTLPTVGLRIPGGVPLVLVLVALGLLAATPGVALYFARHSAGSETSDAPSVAVLPFSDLSPNHDQDYFSDGLAEEILGALTHLDGLRVAGRSSAFSFKGKNEDLPTIARKLHVAAVLEGSVRRAGDRVRITAQLINAADGFNLWSQTFDRQVTGIFEVQEEISAAVVQALRVKLLPGQSLAAERRTSPEAHTQLLIARQLLNRGSADAFVRAAGAFEQAVKLDPQSASAWAGLALASYYVSNLARTTTEAQAAVRRALSAAHQAVTVGPELGEAWAVRGWLRALVDWNWRGAQSDLEAAVRLNGGDAVVLRRYGFLLATLGRLDEAVEQLRRSADLDPLSAEAWDNLGYLYTATGDLDAARDASRRALEIAPEQAYAANHAAVADLLDGKKAEALAAFRKSGEEIFRLQGVAMAASGAEADAALQELTAKYAHNSAFQIAQAHAFRGELDAAFAWLERAYTQRDGGLSLLGCDPLLRKLRHDERYAVLARKLDLPR